MRRRIIKYFVLVCISASFLFPVLYMVTNSLMSSAEVEKSYSAIADSSKLKEGESFNIGFKLIPERVSLYQYYNALLRKPRFLMMFWNSVIVTLPIMAGQMAVSALAAYAFSKLGFPFSKRIFFIYIIVMMMPFQVTLVPNYIILKKLSLLETYSAVILPGVFSTFGVFLLRQFMMSVPDEYCEAAKIDGAGYLRTFTRVLLPQCKGGAASLAILVFIDNWNMVEQPLVFLKDESMYPLSIFLSRINGGEIGIAFACGVFYMTPALLIFLYGENYFIEGIELSGIK
ncbi:multiple sugar transport system permease protein [Anaerobacterium chartisolvens]|uniref:Multiple sugar transport system permease protein n=1 Tax=Anaerobacterium chartisolvens TaxID=1297424 RepID=A0A369AY01_9FIRM|nr:carbohydrate ABC transporter permease [Anaerobacterium chartisolvens]RCX14290.1 multiple sugar transport system permease protein [Anaerobacterium chartisolvens]